MANELTKVQEFVQKNKYYTNVETQNMQFW